MRPAPPLGFLPRPAGREGCSIPISPRIRLVSQRCTLLGSPKPPRLFLRSFCPDPLRVAGPDPRSAPRPSRSACPCYSACRVRGAFCGTPGHRRISGGLSSLFQSGLPVTATAHGGELWKKAFAWRGPGCGAPVNFLLFHVFQALGRPAREAPAASSRRTQRAARRPRLPRPACGAADPPLVSLVQPACDSATRAHPTGNTVSMKQKKKKIPNRVSGTNGDGKISEKPVLDEAPPSAEAQVRVGFPVSFLGAS